MDIKKMALELIEKYPIVKQLAFIGMVTYGLVWINGENLKAQVQLQDLLRTAYENQSLCEDELLQLRKDIKALEKELMKLKLERPELF